MTSQDQLGFSGLLTLPVSLSSCSGCGSASPALESVEPGLSGRLHGRHERVENLGNDRRDRTVFQQSLKLLVILALSRCLIRWKWAVEKLRQVRAASVQVVTQYSHHWACDSCFDMRNVLPADSDFFCDIVLSQACLKTGRRKLPAQLGTALLEGHGSIVFVTHQHSPS